MWAVQGDAMSRISVCLVWLLSFTPIALLAQGSAATHQKTPERDAQSIEILKRVIQAMGGVDSISAIRDITERGEVTFFWGDGQKGSLTIRMLGSRRSRMEADLPDGRSVWVVKDATGSKKHWSDHVEAVSSDEATTMGNFTFPAGRVLASLIDPKTNVSFIGIEHRGGRSVYRLRVTGRLGLLPDTSPISSISKDLIIDALSFDILGVDDLSSRTYELGRPSEKAPHVFEFSDYRTACGVKLPFAIHMKLMGQRAMDIQLSSVTCNTNLSAAEFEGLR